MAELKPFEVIMKIDFAGSNGLEIVAHAEKVAELVRCKDCKYYAEEGMYCANDIIVQFDHFYCYYGERKTE